MVSIRGKHAAEQPIRDPVTATSGIFCLRRALFKERGPQSKKDQSGPTKPSVLFSPTVLVLLVYDGQENMRQMLLTAYYENNFRILCHCPLFPCTNHVVACVPIHFGGIEMQLVDML